MTGLTPDMTDALVVRHGVLRLTFADGLAGEVDVLNRMQGTVFEQARTPSGSHKLRSIERAGPSRGPEELTLRRTRSICASVPACGRTRTLPPGLPCCGATLPRLGGPCREERAAHRQARQSHPEPHMLRSTATSMQSCFAPGRVCRAGPP
jgi:hypothetical protein